MEIYIAFFTGLLGAVLLAVIYLADRWEPEPIELIQSSFLSGLIAQLVLILAMTLFGGASSWTGPWLLVTLTGIGVYLPYQLRRQPELDERFDGIVYTVAFSAGATCAIHLNNLPVALASSPYRDALGVGAEPDLRDLLILAGSAGFREELGSGLVVIATAVLVGAVVGILQLGGTPPGRTAAICGFAALSLGVGDLLAGGHWIVRFMLVVAAVGVAIAVKRRSVFRGRPEPAESDVLVAGAKTVLMIFGAALLATVLLQAAVEQPRSIRELPDRERSVVEAP
ncbi:MAG: hypothetical protein V2I67_19510 [Thermoanaerobaculales bacterium]|jgi:hypothetical protein|nr:hypothetical protein [Thermoanaerobaculales bacterium]